MRGEHRFCVCMHWTFRQGGKGGKSNLDLVLKEIRIDSTCWRRRCVGEGCCGICRCWEYWHRSCWGCCCRHEWSGSCLPHLMCGVIAASCLSLTTVCFTHSSATAFADSCQVASNHQACCLLRDHRRHRQWICWPPVPRKRTNGRGPGPLGCVKAGSWLVVPRQGETGGVWEPGSQRKKLHLSSVVGFISVHYTMVRTMLGWRIVHRSTQLCKIVPLVPIGIWLDNSILNNAFAHNALGGWDLLRLRHLAAWKWRGSGDEGNNYEQSKKLECSSALQHQD